MWMQYKSVEKELIAHYYRWYDPLESNKDMTSQVRHSLRGEKSQEISLPDINSGWSSEKYPKFFEEGSIFNTKRTIDNSTGNLKDSVSRRSRRKLMLIWWYHFFDRILKFFHLM